MNLFMIVMYSYLAAMGIAVWFYYRTLIPGLTSWLWPLAVVGCTASYLVSHSGYIVHPEPLVSFTRSLLHAHWRGLAMYGFCSVFTAFC